MLETESIFETMSAIFNSWKVQKELGDKKKKGKTNSDQVSPEDEVAHGVVKRVRRVQV